MRAALALTCLLVLCADANAGQTLPNWFLTPGATNPDVTQSNIKKTICKPHWTKTIRPRSSYTNSLKRQQIAAYGYTDKRLGSYEEGRSSDRSTEPVA
jgi:hypothetical protein